MIIDAALKESDVFNAGASLVKTLQDAGHPTYFVGGAVRDLLLGRTPHDIDIATAAAPEEVARLIPDSQLVGAAFGVSIAATGGHQFEIATLREERHYLDGRHPEEVKYTDSPELDAQRRDFTINGMFYDPAANQVLDFVGGRDDLKKGVLRCIGKAEDRFSEDWLRMLRAIRFAARFQLELAPDMLPALRTLAPNAKMLAAERIREELNKILLGPCPERAFRMMDEAGLLGELLPEIAALKGVTQPERFHPEGDVFEHTMLMLSHMPSPSVELGWSVLLHDIGKPSTLSFDEDGTEHFYTHDESGAELAATVLERLRMPNDASEAIIQAVRRHMHFAHVHKMRTAKWRRLIAAPTFPLELELHRIDCLCSNSILLNYVLLLDRVRELANETKLPPPLINGRDLMALGVKPGPQLGELLRKISDMQLEGILSSREEALKEILRTVEASK